jgi:GABA permease
MEGLAMQAADDGRPGERHLSKTLKSRHVAMIALGGIIGAGLFVSSSVAIAATGPGILLSYLIAGVIVLLVMRMLGEMVIASPKARLFTDCMREGLGSWGGFVSGWLYWFAWIVVIAVEAIAAVYILQPLSPLPGWATGLILMALMTATNLFSARAFAETEFWFSSIKVAAILAFILLGGAYALGVTPIEGGGKGIANLTQNDGFFPFGFAAVISGVATVFFSLLGAEIATIAAAEAKDGARAVGRLTISLSIRVAIFYVLSILVVICVVPWTAIEPGRSPFVTALSAMGVPGADAIMNFIVLTAVLSCLNAGLYSTSRILFSLAEHGDAPAAMVRLSRRNVPARSILIGGLAGYCGVLVWVISPEQGFIFLVNAVGCLTLFVYMMVVAAFVRQRRRLGADNVPTEVRMWLFPWLSYATFLAMVLILLLVGLNPNRAPELFTSLFSFACVAVAYEVLRRVRRRRSALQVH